jgi:glutaredoxin-like YruB-family protein
MAKVIVYSTPTCPYCKIAKDWLREKGVEYEDFNVAENEEKAKEMVEKTGQMGVPVLDVGGELVIGFDREALSAALGLK